MSLRKLALYLIEERRQLLERMVRGEIEEAEMLLGMTRALPVVVTDGPAGLSGSVKMVAPLPKEEFFGDAFRFVRGLSKLPKREALKRLLRLFDAEKLDPLRLGGLEMAFRHSWENIRATGKATLVFYTPPSTSYELRCEVRIHEEGPVFEYLNLLHDLFHAGGKGPYPAYEFRVLEAYDQSATPEGFGKPIRLPNIPGE